MRLRVAEAGTTSAGAMGSPSMALMTVLLPRLNSPRMPTENTWDLSRSAACLAWAA